MDLNKVQPTHNIIYYWTDIGSKARVQGTAKKKKKTPLFVITFFQKQLNVFFSPTNIFPSIQQPLEKQKFSKNAYKANKQEPGRKEVMHTKP